MKSGYYIFNGPCDVCRILTGPCDVRRILTGPCDVCRIPTGRCEVCRTCGRRDDTARYVMLSDTLMLLFLSDMDRIENDVSNNCPITRATGCINQLRLKLSNCCVPVRCLSNVSVTDPLPSNDRRKYTYKDLWEEFILLFV
jgi:hypothetical protein